jgi:hypothetical protein
MIKGIIAAEPWSLRWRQVLDEVQSVLSTERAFHRVYASETPEQELPFGFRERRSYGSAGGNFTAKSQGLLPVTIGHQAE